MNEIIEKIAAEWWKHTAFAALFIVIWVLLSVLLYKQFFKRFYDIVLSGCALLILSPLLVLLTIIGAVKMKGNPFFVQQRPGKISKKTGQEKIFKLIKFRTMTCDKDANGELLPDEVRLTKYGKFLRSTSLDELPELINIFIGDMSIVGPRPLLVKYVPLYNEEQRHRHDVRPGLTGHAQVNGGYDLSPEEKLKYDMEYIEKRSLFMDLLCVLKTVKIIFSHSGAR